MEELLVANEGAVRNMLRSISTDVPFRGLSADPFRHDGSACVLGRRTVIYGQNGAGKTSLSEILRQGSASSEVEGATVTASLRFENSNRPMPLADPGFPLDVAVYNRFYVADSLALFLDGRGVSDPILKLGQENVKAARRLEVLRELETSRVAWRAHAKAAFEQAKKDAETAEKSVKNQVIAALQSGEPGKYGSATYRVPQVRQRFAEAASSQCLDDQTLLRESEIACEELRQSVSVPADFPAGDASLGSRISSALTRQVDSDSIPSLRSDPNRSAWVEQGSGLHSAGDVCKFCQDGTVTEETLRKYRNHFSDALKDLRTELQGLIQEAQNEIEAGEQWIAGLATPADLLVEYRAAYDSAVNDLTSEWPAFKKQREDAVVLLKKRLADPLTPLAGDDATVSMSAVVDGKPVIAVLKDNEDACQNQVTRKKSAQVAVEQHYASTQVEEYNQAGAAQLRAARAGVTLERNLPRIRAEIEALQRSQQATGIMAARIDEDLRDHFGHGHLSISHSTDGKGYLVKRNGSVATALSEGERNAIAFCYFLASLEADGKDPTRTLVVVDDPVTSMDKEALFAAFALAETRTENFAQTIFLTHDYEYFRLQVRQRANAYEKSQKRIAEGDPAEREYPKVSILEMTAQLRDGKDRVSRLRPLSRQLLQHPSEYHYLFSKVANAVAVESHDELPLLGNAARRLIEGFGAFRAPHGQDFQARIDAITRKQEIDAALSKRVVKFMHGDSHRENPNPVTALDFPSVEKELRAVLTFMHAADPDHFANMCKAVAIEKTLILSKKP
jgi:wobble nucleotide-excising tRNase